MQNDDKGRRKHILTAACRLFHHYGATKTTVADIAQAAEVGTGSVYLEFKSKTEIVEAISKNLLDDVLLAMQRELSEHDVSGTCPVRCFQLAMTARFHAFVEVQRLGIHAPELLHCSSAPVVATWTSFEERQHRLVAQFLQTHVNAFAAFRAPLTDVNLAAFALLAAYATFAPPHLPHSNDDANLALLGELLGEMHCWLFAKDSTAIEE